MAKFFADTYALVEILRGNPNYSTYAEEELYTTEFNLLELSYALTRDFGEKKAKATVELVRSILIVLTPDIQHYVTASTLRLQTRKEGKKLSLIDCLGYVLAKGMEMRFLTGDKEFVNMENVEFVK
ncbi:PIN domain-containing protein [Thermococcus sp. JdF3]|uniref:type II toxin-antitoxin system VapC family toxin n=1 Tax=Thermococcus sp. JdF3 TaxID=1638258 RepID=UPI0014395F62|nr:PIN domain-containing protein [Thermococcus sp. JdF3]NJE01505.1 type II toxin-antitoxin system VapC family toxin [Thermococcus sp. JdF3]